MNNLLNLKSLSSSCNLYHFPQFKKKSYCTGGNVTLFQQLQHREILIAVVILGITIRITFTIGKCTLQLLVDNILQHYRQLSPLQETCLIKFIIFCHFNCSNI